MDSWFFLLDPAVPFFAFYRCATVIVARLLLTDRSLVVAAHPQQAQKGFPRGSFEAYQQALSGDPDGREAAAAVQQECTLPWLLHGLDQLEEHKRVSLST